MENLGAKLRCLILENEGDRDDIYSDVLNFINYTYGWISVEDRHPEIGHDLLIWDGEVKFGFFEDGRFQTEYYYLDDAIYWMYAPEAPNKEAL